MRSVLLAATLLAVVSTPSIAQTYPAKPVRIIVGYAPGGGNDVIARLIAKKFQEETGQPFVVENKVGADTIVATSYVAKSEADGYTLLVTGMGGFTITPTIYGDRVTYDPLKDFIAVGTVARFAYVLAVNTSIKAKTTADLIAYAKANPDKINYGDAAPPTRLATEIFAKQSGIVVHRVPYKGSAASAQALLANDVQMVISDATALIAHQGGGAIDILAVTSRDRLKMMPDIPALAETPSLANFDFDAWVGLFAPAGTNPAIVTRLNEMIKKIVGQSEARDLLTKIGAEALTDTPEQAFERVKRDTTQNSLAAKALNLSAN